MQDGRYARSEQLALVRLGRRARRKAALYTSHTWLSAVIRRGASFRTRTVGHCV